MQSTVKTSPSISFVLCFMIAFLLAGAAYSAPFIFYLGRSGTLISSKINKIIYVGDGSTKSFSVPFYVLSEGDLKLYLINASTSAQTEITSNYGVSPTGGSWPADTCAVNYPTSGDAIASGYKLAIVRSVDYVQPTIYPNNTALKPKVIEKSLDRLTMQTQQLAEAVDRSVKVGMTSSTTPDELINTLTAEAANAVTAASTATTKASEASVSATAAAASQSAAAASQTSAATSASNAATSETNAGVSAATATAKASAAATSETNAASSETNAATAAVTAIAKADIATTAAATATTAANTATDKASEASASATAAAASAASVSYATADEAKAGTVSNKIISPATLKAGLNAAGDAPVSACRAWVNFNGTGTVAIRASMNVSSITDLNTGQYQVNFTNALSDANYSVVVTSNCSTDSNAPMDAAFPISSSACKVNTTGISGGAGVSVDCSQISLAIFR